MFKSFRIATVIGVPVSVHWSLALLAGYLLASGFNQGGAGEAARSAVFVILIFSSVLAHECGHVLAARWYGIPTHAINLSPLGGIAFLDRAPDRPLHQAVVALAGPAVSLIIAVAAFSWAAMFHGVAGLETVAGTLFLVNSILLLFNLLPIYPMDGGQVLKAALQAWFGKSTAATASRIVGQVSGVAMAGVGLWIGSWSLVLIGAFIVISVTMEGRADKSPGDRPLQDALDGEILLPSGMANGIFVAFDGEGRHFAYAKHWLGPNGADEEQLRTIAEYDLEARRKGGRLVLLSNAEFSKLAPQA